MIPEKVTYTLCPTNAVMQLQLTGDRMTTHDPIPTRLAALKSAPTPALRRSGSSCSTANSRPSNPPLP